MNLLEKIALCMECQYLSDLHFTAASSYQVQRIEMLPEDDFTLEEYNKAAGYILQKDVRFSSIKEAKQAIIEYLERIK